MTNHTDDLPDRLDLVVDRCLMHDTLKERLRRIAAAVEGIDREHER